MWPISVGFFRSSQNYILILTWLGTRTPTLSLSSCHQSRINRHHTSDAPCKTDTCRLPSMSIALRNLKRWASSFRTLMQNRNSCKCHSTRAIAKPTPVQVDAQRSECLHWHWRRAIASAGPTLEPWPKPAIGVTESRKPPQETTFCQRCLELC